MSSREGDSGEAGAAGTGGEACVCGSGAPFAQCCKPFLSFQDKPREVKQLLRARYAAYALGGRRDFLLKTWHPATARTFSIADLDNDFVWKSLEILDTYEEGDFGRAEFKAVYAEPGGVDQVHHEKSVFHRLNGTWLYIEGEVAE